MKVYVSLLFLFVSGICQAQHSLVKLWESDSTLAIPESVLYTPGVLYAALIDGEPWGADGKGEIAKLDKNGKILNASWATGLNAPKGMGIWEKKLYVADISDVAVINLADGKIESKIPVAGAEGLNDITVDNKGTVYVSDSKLGKVFEIKNGKASLYLSDLKGVNGLKATDNDLYILTGAGVQKSGPDKKPVLLAAMEIGGDGIEPVGNGDFLVSCWPGLIFYFTKAGKLEQMLDTRGEKKMTADIGYDPEKKIVYVPTFFKKSVVAYQLK
jgi:hypothetical protein